MRQTGVKEKAQILFMNVDIYPQMFLNVGDRPEVCSQISIYSKK